MAGKIIDYDEAMAAYYKENSDMALAVLNESLKEGDQETFMVILGQIVRAGMSVAALSNQTRLNENTLHHTLSGKGNPTLKTLLTIFNALGLTLSINVSGCQQTKKRVLRK